MDKKFWQSKKFIMALIGILAMILIAFIPELANSESQIVDNVTYIVMLAIAGFTFQDIGILWLQKPGSVKLVGQGTQFALDTFERVTKREIPDKLEKTVVEEVVGAAQVLADKNSTTITSATTLQQIHSAPVFDENTPLSEDISNAWLTDLDHAKG